MAERELLEPLTTLFTKRGYFVLSPHTPGLNGRGELAIEVEFGGDRKPRRVDVVAAKWLGDHDVAAVAVESKASTWAVYDGLGQAVQYQSVFDEVYIATPFALGVDGIARSTLVDLGLGNITVPANEDPFVGVVPQQRQPSRFEPHAKELNLTRRLGLGLAFREIADDPIMRYGFWNQSLSVWYAEEVSGHGHIQWNCGEHHRGEPGSPYESFFGINVEHAEDLRRILPNMSTDRLRRVLKQIPAEYQIEVMHDPWPANERRQTPPKVCSPVRRASPDKILQQLDRRAAAPGYKPHLWVGLRDDQWRPRGHEDYLDKLRTVRLTLAPMMEGLLECWR